MMIVCQTKTYDLVVKGPESPALIMHFPDSKERTKARRIYEASGFKCKNRALPKKPEQPARMLARIPSPVTITRY